MSFIKWRCVRRSYQTIEELQIDLDQWLVKYNTQRTHQGKCAGGERRWKHSSTENQIGRKSL
jgi:hypothetical protein